MPRVVGTLLRDSDSANAFDATLVALAGLDSSAGLVEQTGADAFAKRALGVGASTSVLTRSDGDGRYTGVTGLFGAQSVAAFKTGLSLAKGDVGLGSVDNTADTAKPVSTAQQTALDLKLNLAGGSLSNFLTLHADPSSALHAATKQYVDSVASGLNPKASVKAATTANITLSGNQTIDGVSITAGMRVLVKNQSTASQNGIYVSSASAWARALDQDAWAEVPGAFVFVEEGTANADTGWVSTANAGGTLGSTSIAWTQFSGAGAYTASGGITQSGVNFALTDMAQATFKGRAAGGGTGAPQDLTPAQAKTALAITASDVSGLATVATSGSASDLGSGALPAGRMPALTGDVTTSAGAVAATIANDAVTYAKMQNVSATDKLLGRSTSGAGDVEEIACTAAGRALLDDAAASDQRTTLGLAAIAASGSASDLASGTVPMARLSDDEKTVTLNFVIDGGGVVIVTGIKGDVVIDFPCTIISATLLADQSGSIVVDIFKDTYANFPPVIGDKITASAPPTISSATKSQDATLTGWTTSIAAGDVLRPNVNSVTTIQRVTLSLKLRKT